MGRYIILSLVFLFGINLHAQKDTEEKQVEKANFRVQIFQKVDSSEIILTHPDPEFKDKLPISAVIRDSAAVSLQDMPRAAEIDSVWRAQLTDSDLFETMYKSIREQDYKEEVYKELPTDTLKARLAKLNARTPFNVEYHPILEKVINSYLNRNKKAMERLMAISEYYFPMFEQQLDRYDIPLEIKYLAIVESALNPRAKSWVGATGLWQFMYRTGKAHGLDVSSYVDERMDPQMSTEAAAKYLATLYRTFEDWDLVLASYNSGPGNVSKAIRRSGGSHNYWELRRFLPRETAGYVPAFLATLYLFEYAEEHNFQPQRPEIAFFETDTIKVKQLITFEQISEVTGVEKEMLQFLNPSYKLDVIPFIEDENYMIRLPTTVSGAFVSNEDAIYNFAEKDIQKEEKAFPEFVKAEEKLRYRVRSGDYLGRIAQRYGVGVSSIKRWNNLRSNNLRIGQYLTIYPRKPGVVAQNKKDTSEEISSTKTYTVKKGDSLWSISRKFPGITVQNLRSWNDMGSNSLKPGMELKLFKG
ncbi:membrane-bound lytic murein transglycosylase D [Salegentibacter sp. 24]|jgi:membrane-bound lytic murein transglycosylase D|uniref:LysM peptidoglycan-binding domain-containing protein n=1 Tax=Salegentibacter sp. 24 TaxID=2183986 RepID=UPI0010608A6F|nr:LysM peptidoglycan-binding domain-containing protein [Salegentibacter sp. 24]TDN83459.1 membrane-bound lytic murein transglycosylase D [Salegentibacter sp. 24]